MLTLHKPVAIGVSKGVESISTLKIAISLNPKLQF
jgi:hypothetical protein